MGKFLETILKSYQDKAPLIKQKARILAIIYLIESSMTMLYIPVILISEKGAAKLTMSALMVVTLTVLLFFLFVFLKRGHFIKASNLLVYANFVVLTSAAFLSDAGMYTHYRLYNVSFLMMFSLLLGSVLFIRTYQYLIISVAGFIGILSLYFTKIHQLDNTTAGIKLYTLLTCIIFFSIAVLLASILNKIVNKSLQKTEKQAAENKQRAEKLHNILASVKEGMQVGTSLVLSAEKSSEIVFSVKDRINHLQNEVTVLNHKMDDSLKQFAIGLMEIVSSTIDNMQNLSTETENINIIGQENMHKIEDMNNRVSEISTVQLDT